jgi:hypothetical protein
MSGIFEDRSRVKGNSSDIVRRKLDTSGQDKLTKTIKDNFVKAETDSLEREILLSKPELAKKIRVYQNETDINDPEYVDGYTDIVEEHYGAFQAQSKVANEFLRRQEMAVKDSYQTAGVNYQIKGLMREDNERIRTYLNETMNTTMASGALPFNAVEDMNRIIDLSLNIPNELKGALKKNATNDILTTEIQTSIRNDDDVEGIKEKLKTYKKYIDPQKYKTLHKQIKISEQQNERALARLNTRVIKGFAKDLTGYTNCVTTNNCSPETANLRENIKESGIDDESKNALIERFDDINELSEIFTEISNDVMGSYKSVESYITKNPDNDSNNLRRNNILRTYYNDKRMEFKKDPVQFVIDNNDEVKELVDQLDGTENQQALQSEIRETISSAIGMHSNRMLTNAEIDDISTTDDYKEQLAKIKQVISEKGKTVVDELIERKAVTKDIKAIGNISDIPVQHRVMELIRDEKEIKQLYANTPNSFDRTASILKGKRYYTDFIEASYIKTDAPDEVNSITKLTILQAMRDGDFSPENLESNFNTLMGDAQVVDKVIVPRDIPESLAKERLTNVKDSDFLYRVLKSKDIDFKGRIISIGAPDGIDVISRFAEEVESGDIEIAVEQGAVVFVKGGMFVRDDSGNLLRIPFDKFNPIEKSVDKELFMKNPHYMNYEVLDALRKL